jgi:hypothetical protein
LEVDFGERAADQNDKLIVILGAIVAWGGPLGTKPNDIRRAATSIE